MTNLLQKITSAPRETYRIGDLGRVVTGKTPSKDNPQDWGDEIDFITPTDFSSDEKYLSHIKRQISQEGAGRYKNMIVPPDSVVVTCIGSDMGKVVLSRNTSLTNQQINTIIVDKNSFDLAFTYYTLKALYPTLRSIAEEGGSTMPIITKSTFENIEFEAPDLATQKKIAEILSAHDAKIENNNLIIKNLELMAQTLFDEWFVKFRFPGYEKSKFIESEMGQLPEGWEASSLGRVSSNHDSKRVPLASMERNKRKGNIPYYGANGILDYIDEAIYSGEYILFAEDGTVKTEKNTPVIYLVDGDFWVNNHAHIISGKSVSNYFLYLSLRKINIDPYVTGGVQPKITQHNLNSIPVLVPDSETLGRFEQFTKSVNRLLKETAKENKFLVQSRDQLLAKLI